MPPTDCPSAADLNDLLQGRLGAEPTTALEEHVGGCPRCQQVVDALVGGLPLIKAIRGAAPPAEPDVPGELVARLDDLASQFTRVGWECADSAEPIDLAPSSVTGDVGQLGPYRVLELLGAGGMGMVYLAEDTGLRRRVALKLLRPQLARHPRARDGFLREARAMAALKHDNVVTVFQVSEAPSNDGDAVPYLAMELLEGESLADWLRREGAVPAGWAVRLGRQAAEGLAAAHAREVLHRDIKPGNLWLEAPTGWTDLPPARRPALASVGRLKILDFGLAQRVGDDSGDAAGFGTPAYMSPEHTRDEKLSPSADLFSLGVVLYELTTGRLPFAADARSGAPVYRAPADVRAFAPDAPRAFAELVQQLLRLGARERPESAGDVAGRLAALADLSATETRATGGATVPIRRTKPTRRRRTVVGVLLALSVVGGAWLSLRGAHDPSPPPSEPVPAAHAQFPPGRDTDLSGPPDEEWCRRVGELPPEQQLATVLEKLRELNPAFDGQVRAQVADGCVKSLSITTDQVRDIRPLRACKRLQKLECNGSARDKGQLTDLSPIQGLPLVELNCWWNCGLRDMSPVRGMALVSTQFGETPVEDLSPFAGMPLETLCVNGCPIRTAEIVRTLPRLRFFNCNACPLETLEPLVGSTVVHLAFDFQANRGDAKVVERMVKLERVSWRPAREFRKKHGIQEPKQ